MPNSHRLLAPNLDEQLPGNTLEAEDVSAKDKLAWNIADKRTLRKCSRIARQHESPVGRSMSTKVISMFPGGS